MSVSVQPEDFDLGEETGMLLAEGDIGAVASFTGYVRGGQVHAMTLEHYPGMTERTLAGIESEAMLRWQLRAVRIVHRVGRLLPGEQIVFVGVAARHRQEAFAACEFIMDHLKTRAPFWKQEETPEGARWVEARESDENAVDRWR